MTAEEISLHCISWFYSPENVLVMEGITCKEGLASRAGNSENKESGIFIVHKADILRRGKSVTDRQ